jgi:hypothetical protein
MDNHNKLFFDVMDQINVIQLDIDKGKTKYLKKKVQEKTQVEQKHGNILSNLNIIMYHIFIKDKTFMPSSISFLKFSFDEEPQNVIILMSNNELQFQRVVVVAI